MTGRIIGILLLGAGILRAVEAAAPVPWYGWVAYDLGRDAERDGRPDRARVWYRRAVRYDPGLARAWYALGDLDRREGRTRDAVAELQRAVTDPEFHEAFNALGLALRDGGYYPRALASFRRAIRISVALGPAPYRFNEGVTYLMTGDLVRARREIEELEFHGNDVWAAGLRAVLVSFGTPVGSGFPQVFEVLLP